MACKFLPNSIEIEYKDETGKEYIISLEEKECKETLDAEYLNYKESIDQKKDYEMQKIMYKYFILAYNNCLHNDKHGMIKLDPQKVEN